MNRIDKAAVDIDVAVDAVRCRTQGVGGGPL